MNLTSQSRASKILFAFKGSCAQISLFGVMQLELQSLFLALFRMVTKFFFGNRPYSIENRSSALHQRRFVQGAIS